MLKKSIVIAAILTSTLAISIRAQQGPAVPPPPAAATTGPTMEQTVGFISTALETQGTVKFRDLVGSHEEKTTIQLKEPCSLSISDGTSTKTMFDLQRSDPRSVHVSEVRTTPTTYRVTMDRAITWRELPEHPTPAPSAPKNDVDGIIYSIDLPMISVVPWRSNTLFTYIITKKTLLFSTTSEGPKVISLSDVKIGDVVQMSPGKSNDGATELQQLLDSGNINEHSGKQSPGIAELFDFFDPDTAERVSKALIHAMVLCHKAEAPSLF